MKKFLSKLWVMILSLVLVVFASGALLLVLAPKVCIVGNYYSDKEYQNLAGENFVSESWLNFHLDNTVTCKQVVKNVTTGEVKEETIKQWYYVYGKTLFQVGDTEDMTKEEYKKAVEKIKNMTDAEYKAYKDEMGYVITFKAVYLSNESSLREGDLSKYVHFIHINKTKIPLMITFIVVDTLVLALATASVVCFVLNKKNKTEKTVVDEQVTPKVSE